MAHPSKKVCRTRNVSQMVRIASFDLLGTGENLLTHMCGYAQPIILHLFTIPGFSRVHRSGQDRLSWNTRLAPGAIQAEARSMNTSSRAKAPFIDRDILGLSRALAFCQGDRLDHLGRRCRITRFAPLPFGGDSSTLSSPVISPHITAQQTGIR